MRLKKMTLLGFKSFADKTVLYFEAGITCIVGPNGCGKSNISDAFRWVLGEQSAKSMRGAKMPDVIFAGTSQRKPLNYAEVSLTLTDVQNALPIDYEEVTITRRLHRSGESEYLLNGNPVCLKDLQTLFLDSGVGRNAFSIFEQGKLDQVISYSPIERRYIFEEAAGILRFLQRKKEALKRLEQTDYNLARAHDIHLEVERQIQTLESQAQRARVYKEQQAELALLEKAGFVLKWQAVEKKQADIKTKQEKQIKNLEECRRQGLLRQAECQDAKQQRSQQEKTLRARSEALLTLKGQQEFLGKECQSLQNRLKELQQREKKLKQELEDLTLSRQTRQQLLGEMGKKVKGLETDWSDAEAKWMGQQDKVKSLEKEVSRLRQELSLKHQAHVKGLQQSSERQSELKQAEIRLESQSHQQSQLEKRLKFLTDDSLKYAESLQEKKQALRQISALVDSHKERLEQYEGEIKKVIQETEKNQKEGDILRSRLIEIKARQRVLTRMREEHEGFSSGGKKLLEEGEKVGSALYQKLRPFYTYFETETASAEAVAVALRAYAQTLVVETDEDFQLVLDYAEKAGLEDYSIICLDHIDNSRRSARLSTPSLMEGVAPNRLVSHFLQEIATGQTRDELLTAWSEGKCLEGWSRQGMFVDHRGVFFKVKRNDNVVFLREAELKHLEEDLISNEQQLVTLEQAFQHMQHRRTHLQLERAEIDKLLRRDEMKLVEVNFGLQRILSDQEKNGSEKSLLEKDLIVLKESRVEQKRLCQALEEKYEAVKQELTRLQQDKDDLQQELNRQEATHRIQDQDQKEKGSRYRQLAEERQHLLHQRNLLESKEQDHGKHVSRIEEELQECVERQNQIKTETAQGQSNLGLMEGQLKEAAQQVEGLEKICEGLLQLCEQADHRLALHSDEVRRIEHDLAQIDMQLFQQKTALESIAEELSSRFQLTIEEAFRLNLPMQRSLEQTERLIRNLRHALQETGDVNLAAIEDLEKHQVRYQFLKQQMDDMQQSKDELLAIIQQLDGESHKLFKETFEIIRTNFKKNFQILFNGGEADLQFTESKDILEAGIEISAKPPGKQMRSISLLSGGEKCLTAVALLFAIFEVKSAPFCILDEIDAPLDDSNVERFVNVVKHFADKCQFLIITHNKRTMAIGDTIFGVTMEEKGVSKLLSLEFAHRETPEATLVS